MKEHPFASHSGSAAGNRPGRFLPAFLDAETGNVYLACYRDGRPAPMHVPDGLPRELVITRNDSTGIAGVKACVVAGFVFRGRFFTREQAARAIAH